MIRSTKHILKYQTKTKTQLIDKLFEIYEAELCCYVDMLFIGEMKIQKFMSTKDVKSIYIHGGRWRQLVYKHASEIIRGNGINNEKKPVLKNFSIILDEKFFDIEWNKNKEFDGFIRIRLPFKNPKYKKNIGITIKVPVKHHSHSIKYKNWKLRKSIQLLKRNENYYAVLIWEKPEPKLKKNGERLGFDFGYRYFLVDSNAEFRGTDLKEVYNKLARQKHGSKNHKQTLAYRDNKINEICNKLPIENYREVIVEDLKNVKKNSKFSRKVNNKMQYWSYCKGSRKLERLCEENGVLFTQVDPAYTSQCCPKCGFMAKENRVGEKFLCKKCSYADHADVVGAVNIRNRGVYSPSITRKQIKEMLQ